MPLPQGDVSLTVVIEAKRLWEGNPFPDNRGKDASPTGEDCLTKVSSSSLSFLPYSAVPQQGPQPPHKPHPAPLA